MIRGKLKKVKAVNWFRKEMKKIKESPEQVQKRIAVFYEEYNRQHKIIPKKLAQAKKNGNKEAYNRILLYQKETDKLREKIDRFVFDIQDEERKKTLGEKIRHSKMGTFTLIFRDMKRINEEFKKENCDIDNFEV